MHLGLRFNTHPQVLTFNLRRKRPCSSPSWALWVTHTGRLLRPYRVARGSAMAQAYTHGKFDSRNCKVGWHRARFCEERGAHSDGEIAGKGGKERGARAFNKPLQFHEPPDRMSLLKIIPAHQFDRGSLSKFGQKWTKICPNMSKYVHLGTRH